MIYPNKVAGEWPGQEARTQTVTITRPNDTNAYAVSDAWADSTSAPVVGGFAIPTAARTAGQTGFLSDILVISSNDPATKLQGEIWIFDSQITAINDNAAFALSDADAIKKVKTLPFTLQSDGANNSSADLENLNIEYQCVGSPNLYFLVRVLNVYTPAALEALTFRFKTRFTN